MKFATFTKSFDGQNVLARETSSGALMHVWDAAHPDLDAMMVRFERNMEEASHAGAASDSKAVFATPPAPKPGPVVSLTAHVLPVCRALGVAC